MASSQNKAKAQLNPFYIEPGGVPQDASSNAQRQQQNRWEGDYWQDDEEGVENEGLLEYGNNSSEPDDNGKGIHPNHSYNRNVGRTSPHERKIILGAISLFLILIVAASVRNSDSKNMSSTKPSTPSSTSDGGGLSATTPRQPLLPYPDRVVFLGERHSGVDFYREKFRECFPNEVKFESSLTRESMWFQDPPEEEEEQKRETLLFILLVRDPYTWVEAMRTLPPFWNMPDHALQRIQVNNSDSSRTEERFEPIPWEEFVEKPWTHNEPPSDDNDNNNNNNNNNPGTDGGADGGAGSEPTPNDDAGTGDEGEGGVQSPPTTTHDQSNDGTSETASATDDTEGGATAAANPDDEVGAVAPGDNNDGNNDDALLGLFHDNDDKNGSNDTPGDDNTAAEGGEGTSGGNDEKSDGGDDNSGNSDSGNVPALPNELDTEGDGDNGLGGSEEIGGGEEIGGDDDDAQGSDGDGDDLLAALGGDGDADDLDDLLDAIADEGDDDDLLDALGGEGGADDAFGNEDGGDDLLGGDDALGGEGGGDDDYAGDTGDGGRKDRRGLDAHKCQLGFTDKQVVPCQQPPGTSSQVSLDLPVYELDPMTGEVFPNILALRKAKIEHYTNTLVEWYKDRLIGPLVVFHYEQTVWFSLEQLAKEFKGSAWTEGVAQHCRNVNIQPPPLDHKLDNIDQAYEPYLTKHIDWQTEEQIGYQPKKH